MTENELTDADKNQLMLRAREVRAHAYAPYSKFAVGAALLATTGDIYCGANVENSSFGLTICAERVALGAAVADGKQQFTAIAITSAGGHMPCGACRQVLAEFGDLLVLAVDAEDTATIREIRLSELLPNGFRFERK